MELKKDKNVREFLVNVKDYFGKRLKKILFFGSRARGNASPESDYDCILLVDEIGSQDEKFIDEIEIKLLLEKNILFSTFLTEEYKFNQRKYEPFLMNAKKEGIYL
ncbi:hypothetical protein A2526_01420 [candidate division WOR-1 bacterium RIFOXYD2_FULL_36_8]|uniref:Polymerase nucleotidyl transferase domain-containing protein n=1 Tax=candidate division WOR-1 bacterium RIFOXYB2_FULL_36_35 TaxID=1802578 RepID=A0A1F4S172_UNCSA|nr:MAG: hypothetical protein A2230_03595 [candidate division WOR-1 bacterium RIFOXYA2_FULL_36_21]OGC14181.1 MAG: hypothetical protein A2290_00705 [candidate division WOR-1 bacterium RIFOXYB2_FULL_36_35]OGC19046.1 MAG: hypothetical protein A2282_01895 [candidate division WOR-1 bacterium RIFOXYA12_FULL_36_13]OGC38719.1 MAG: hypothetical protein A2526_01420 [candidate division WOR-1 bacterium RIFOXYD2_FULL_36_8]